MPLLAGMLVTLFGGLATYFSAWMAKKAAFALAAVVTFAGLTAALVVAIQAIVSGMIGVFPETGSVVLTMLWVAVPDVAPAFVAACISVDTAVFLYRWNVENLRLASYVT